jgi:hypothetical protein
MKINYSIYLLGFVCSLFTLTVYSSSDHIQIDHDFVELCSIYEDISRLNTNLSEKEGELTQQIFNKLPILFTKMYTHVMKADVTSRYDLINQYKMQISGTSWDCNSARMYYDSAFQE